MGLTTARGTTELERCFGLVSGWADADRTLLLHRSAAGPGKGWAGGRQLVEGADFSGTEEQPFFSEEGLCAAAPCPPVPGSSRQAKCSL